MPRSMQWAVRMVLLAAFATDAIYYNTKLPYNFAEGLACISDTDWLCRMDFGWLLWWDMIVALYCRNDKQVELRWLWQNVLDWSYAFAMHIECFFMIVMRMTKSSWLWWGWQKVHGDKILSYTGRCINFRLILHTP